MQQVIDLNDIGVSRRQCQHLIQNHIRHFIILCRNNQVLKTYPSPPMEPLLVLTALPCYQSIQWKVMLLNCQGRMVLVTLQLLLLLCLHRRHQHCTIYHTIIEDKQCIHVHHLLARISIYHPLPKRIGRVN